MPLIRRFAVATVAGATLLVAAALPAAAHVTVDPDSTGRTLAILGIVVGAAGLVVAIVALTASRRRPSDPTQVASPPPT